MLDWKKNDKLARGHQNFPYLVNITLKVKQHGNVFKNSFSLLINGTPVNGFPFLMLVIKYGWYRCQQERIVNTYSHNSKDGSHEKQINNDCKHHICLRVEVVLL